jgi:hypothetical protein
VIGGDEVVADPQRVEDHAAKRFRGSATKFPAYGSPVFAPDIDPTRCFSRDIDLMALQIGSETSRRTLHERPAIKAALKQSGRVS